MCSTDRTMLPRTENPSVCCVADCCACGAPGTAKTLITKSPTPMVRRTLLFMVQTPFIQFLRGLIVARFLPKSSYGLCKAIWVPRVFPFVLLGTLEKLTVAMEQSVCLYRCLKSCAIS